MEGVVHYSDRTYSSLKQLTTNQHNRLLQAKELRVKELLDVNRHTTQCNDIPSEGKCDVNRHGVHTDPCYKKFVSILKEVYQKRKSKLPHLE